MRARQEVTFRDGRVLAAYLHIAPVARGHVARTEELANGLIVDFDARGRPVGVEILEPRTLSQRTLNRTLKALGAAPVSRSDLAPLHAA